MCLADVLPLRRCTLLLELPFFHPFALATLHAYLLHSTFLLGPFPWNNPSFDLLLRFFHIHLDLRYLDLRFAHHFKDQMKVA